MYVGPEYQFNVHRFVVNVRSTLGSSSCFNRSGSTVLMVSRHLLWRLSLGPISAASGSQQSLVALRSGPWCTKSQNFDKGNEQNTLDIRRNIKTSGRECTHRILLHLKQQLHSITQITQNYPKETHKHTHTLIETSTDLKAVATASQILNNSGKV